MEIRTAEFVKSASKPEEYPQYRYPEVAFFGRSNCGKSSLINMLVNRKDLVKTGSKPGMTRLVNFFLINGALSLVDMPGFGYAEAPKEERLRFVPMAEEYFRNRENLKMIFLLQDIRRSPGDEEVLLADKFDELKLPFVIVATKADKLNKADTALSVRHMSGILGKPQGDVFVTSVTSRKGRSEMLALLSSLTK
jgi:GTP-binding protein